MGVDAEVAEGVLVGWEVTAGVEAAIVAGADTAVGAVVGIGVGAVVGVGVISAHGTLTLMGEFVGSPRLP